MIDGFTTYYAMARIRAIGRSRYVTIPYEFGFEKGDRIVVSLKKSEGGESFLFSSKVVAAGHSSCFNVPAFLSDDLKTGDYVLFGITKDRERPAPLLWTNTVEVENGPVYEIPADAPEVDLR